MGGNERSEFLKSAFPWIVIGIAVAIFAVIVAEQRSTLTIMKKKRKRLKIIKQGA